MSPPGYAPSLHRTLAYSPSPPPFTLPHSDPYEQEPGERPKTHDSARSAKDLGGKVGRKLGLGDTRLAVRTRDSAPDDADAGTVDLALGLVDIGDAL